MVVFGLILLIIGFVLAIKLLWTIGMIVLLVGLVLWPWVRWATPSAVEGTTTRSRVPPDPGRCPHIHRPGIFSYLFVTSCV